MADRIDHQDSVGSTFQLKTLLNTSRLLIESRDTDLILDNLLHITMEKMLVPHGAVLLYEEKEKRYKVTRIKGNARVMEGGSIKLPWSHGEFEEMVIDPASHGFDPPELFHGKNRGLYFHLKTSNHHIGYLYLGRKGDDKILDDQEIEFVESLSIISAVAISNSQLFSQMRKMNRKLDRRVFELNTLFELSKDFSLTVNREEIASKFKHALLGHLLVRKFFLLFKIGDDPALLTSSGLLNKPKKKERSQIFELPQEILRVQEHQKRSIPFLEENEIAILVALRMQGDKVAVIGVSEKANEQPLSQSNFNFLQSLGNLAVLSIQKTLFLEDRIERERLEREVMIAKRIQEGLFPGELPSIEALDVDARNIPSRHVGGDYYDVVRSPDGTFIFAIGDVTGKGFPAALLMANLQSMLHVLLPVDISLSEATGRINNLIYQNTPSDKFVTFFWAKFYPDSNRLRYINAGHNPPLLLRRGNSEPEELGEGGLILGVMPTVQPYQETDLHLESGDILICYTDGVTESFNAEDEEYEKERLREILKRERDKPASEILDAIIRDVDRFSQGIVSDDLTLIVLKVR